MPLTLEVWCHRKKFTTNDRCLSLDEKTGDTMSTGGASLRKLGYSSVTPKEKKTIRNTNEVLVIQTANGVVESKSEATVFIQELGTSLH